MATVLDLAVAALQDLGVLAANETAGAGDAAFCLSTLNRIVDQWAVERRMIYAVTRSTWTINTGDGSYTVGSGGNINIPWPVFVDHVNFVDTSADPDEEYPLVMLTDDAYAAIPAKALTSVLPANWYYDRAYSAGLGNLVLWPVPTSTTLTGVIYAATQVSEFASTSTSVVLPPGYREAIVTELALRMAPAYNRLDIYPALKDSAEKAIAKVKVSNARILDMSVDAAALGRSGHVFDIYTGA